MQPRHRGQQQPTCTRYRCRFVPCHPNNRKARQMGVVNATAPIVLNLPDMKIRSRAETLPHFSTAAVSKLFTNRRVRASASNRQGNGPSHGQKQCQSNFHCRSLRQRCIGFQLGCSRGSSSPGCASTGYRLRFLLAEMNHSKRRCQHYWDGALQESKRVAGARITLSGPMGSAIHTLESGANGQFSLRGLAPDFYKVTVTAPGMNTYASPAIKLNAGEFHMLPPIVLSVSEVATSVTVTGNKAELAQEQLHIAVQQRIGGVIPNFYSSYDWNAPPQVSTRSPLP